MDPVKRDEPHVGGVKSEICSRKASVTKQAPSVAKTDAKVASVGKRINIEFKVFVVWLSKVFTAWLSKVITTPSGRLRKQIAALKEKMEQKPGEHSVAYLSDKARQIALKPQFATIAKNLQGLAIASTAQDAAQIIQTARNDLLALIPDENDQWNAELRQELWRQLFLTSCDHPPVSVDRFLKHAAKLLTAVQNSPDVKRELKDYSAIAGDALSSLTSRLNLVGIENRLDVAKVNFPPPKDQKVLDAFQKLQFYPQQTEMVTTVTIKNLKECLQTLSDNSHQDYKQFVAHANNPIWCSKQGLQKLSQISAYLQSQPDDNSTLISKIKLLQKAIEELMR